ncbi:MAG TPA: zinc ribbon domain-containing protein [Candidatus Binatia bacterium]|nr:zinc ribbon domain-containing protein [Candidatus Binatia bacterium]
MPCLSCGSENPAGAKFCIECAAPLNKRCPSCGVENLPRTKFCSACATPLAGQSGVQSPRSTVQSPEESAVRSQNPQIRNPLRPGPSTGHAFRNWKPRRVFSRPSRLPADSRQSRWNCER